MRSFAILSCRFCCLLKTINTRQRCRAVAVAASLLCVSTPALVAQHAAQNPASGAEIEGTVRSSAGNAVDNAVVRIAQKGSSSNVEAKTDRAGAFTFSGLGTGTYIVSAEKSGARSRATAVIVASEQDRRQVDLLLEDSKQPHADSSASSAQAMEFADKPNFTIAGVTDWTAAGGHGSDSTLRASEALTRETLTLKPGNGSSAAAVASGGKQSEGELRAALGKAPESFAANRQLGELYLHAGKYRDAIPLLESSYRIDAADRDNEYDLAVACKGAGDFAAARAHVRNLLAHAQSADLHRLAGEVEEQLGDPLAAVHEFEQAVRMEPSEQNYFEWGSELLLHRAVWQAQEVFGKGAEAYPKSARMLTALGTAFFSSALYDQAALRVCDASDLNPASPEPYLFLGKIEMSSPDPLTCVEPKLARFVREQPANAQANYLYAMTVLKHRQPGDEKAVEEAESLLKKAVTLDARCSEAYFQLGVLSFSRRDYPQAIGFFAKAVEANPQMAEAHYRLGMAYDRTGEAEKAKQEFQLHAEIKKQQAAKVDRERREVKQFLVIQPGKQGESPVH